MDDKTSFPLASKIKLLTGYYLFTGTLFLYAVYYYTEDETENNFIETLPIEGILDLNFSPTEVPTPTELPHASLWKNHRDKR